MHIIKLRKLPKLYIYFVILVSQTCVSQTPFVCLGHRTSSTINWMYSDYINRPMCWWGLLYGKPLDMTSPLKSTH